MSSAGERGFSSSNRLSSRLSSSVCSALAIVGAATIRLLVLIALFVARNERLTDLNIYP